MPALTPVPLEGARAHVLAKQGLLGARLPTVIDAVIATAGIYGTAPTCYLSCAARVEGFHLGDLDEALYARRTVVRLRCMRGGMAYIEPLDLLPTLFACTGEPRDKTLARIARWGELPEREVLELADRIEAAMDGRPPVTVREIRELLGGEIPGGKSALQFTVALLGRYGRIVRADVRGSWRSDNYAYARWIDWLGDSVTEIDPAAARGILALRYLAAFGPATAADLQWWTGWTKRDTVAAIAGLGDEIATVSMDGLDAWLPARELPALAAMDPRGAHGVRLLPVWDAYFMGYAPRGRARQVAPEAYDHVYDKSGNCTSTVSVDGRAAGVWELDEDTGTVTVAAFGDVVGGELADRWSTLETEVARLAVAIGAELKLQRAPAPRPLVDGPRNAFLSPISIASR